MIVGPAHIGRHSTIGDFSHVAPQTTIGRYCSIANSCTIGAPPPSLDWLSTHAFQQRGLIGATIATRPWEPPATKLGHDVSIGANAVVLAGLTIGDGAAVEAGSVVTRDVPPYAVVGGNPAKVMKTRFSRKIVAELLSLAWWDLPPAELAALPFDDIGQCVARLREIRRRIAAG
ncbi:MAG: CatB-related O-acetyltransferase [Pseudomonadota bacterium]